MKLLITATVPDSYAFYFLKSDNLTGFCLFYFLFFFSSFVCASRGLVSFLHLRKKCDVDTCSYNYDGCLGGALLLAFILHIFFFITIIALTFRQVRGEGKRELRD